MTTAHTATAIRALASVAILALTAGGAAAVGQIGDPAADFSLQNLEGGQFTMSQYQGNSVVFLAVIGYG